MISRRLRLQNMAGWLLASLIRLHNARSLISTLPSAMIYSVERRKSLFTITRLRWTPACTHPCSSLVANFSVTMRDHPRTAFSSHNSHHRSHLCITTCYQYPLQVGEKSGETRVGKINTTSGSTGAGSTQA